MVVGEEVEYGWYLLMGVVGRLGSILAREAFSFLCLAYIVAVFDSMVTSQAILYHHR